MKHLLKLPIWLIEVSAAYWLVTGKLPAWFCTFSQIAGVL